MDSLVVCLHDVTCDHLFAARVVGILVDFRESCCWHRKGCSKSQRCMFDHEYEYTPVHLPSGRCNSKG